MAKLSDYMESIRGTLVSLSGYVDPKHVLGELRKTGICAILDEVVAHPLDCSDDANGLRIELNLLVTKYATEWEHYSGNAMYPVPAPAGFLKTMAKREYENVTPESAASAYYSILECDGRWRNDEYGDSRRDLCKHLIKCIDRDFK